MSNKQNYLVVPKGVEVSRTGLKITARLSFEEWAELGKHLQAVHRSVLFWIGDWLLWGERKWGEKFSQAIEATGYAVQTLMNAQWVSSRIDFSRRTGELSWSHHMEVAALEPAEQDRLLQAAIDNRWSTRELREAVKASKTQVETLAPKCSNTDIEETRVPDNLFQHEPSNGAIDVNRITRGAIAYLERELSKATPAELAQVVDAIVRRFRCDGDGFDWSTGEQRAGIIE